MIKKKIIIASGGTGGHVFPACSLANYLIKENFDVKLTTDKRGLEYLKDYKILDLVVIPSTSLNKKNILKLFSSIILIILSIFKSFLFLINNRPSIIFGMGGYSSFPICLAAKILGIKFIIYENNMVIGKANKYLLPLANKIFVSYKELQGISKKYEGKVVEIGNLVREEIINFKSNQSSFDKFDEIKILTLGGSQGAKIFADVLPQIFAMLNNSGIPIKVYQQCKKEQNNQLSDFYEKNGINFEIFNFTNQITDYYSKTNLVITRSGASVLGELINFNIPFISIPLPSSADDHQYKNAEFYHKKGYGYLVEEKDINNKLYDLIKLIFKNKSLIKEMLSKQKQYSDKNIFKNLNEEIKKSLNEKN